MDLSEAFLSHWPGFGQKVGLRRLVAYALGLRINKSKAIQISNWDNRPLTPQQLACVVSVLFFCTLTPLADTLLRT
jgi:hypothetical protein